MADHDHDGYPISDFIMHSPRNPITNCHFNIDVEAGAEVCFHVQDESGSDVTRGCDGTLKPLPVGTIYPTTGIVPNHYLGQACLCGLRPGSQIRITVCSKDDHTKCATFVRDVSRDVVCTGCGGNTVTNDDKTCSLPKAPVLVEPPEPIDSCGFKLVIEADGPVYVEIYDEKGIQVTRACVGSTPGPIGTLFPTNVTGTKYYKADVCLCGITNGSMIRIVICDVSPLGFSVSYARTVNHDGTCPPCRDKSRPGLDSAVDELRDAITARVVEKMREVVDAIVPPPPEPAPPAASKDAAKKSKKAAPASRENQPRPGRRRKTK